MVVLVARIGPLERTIGQDRLLRWHRRLAPWPLSLIVLHVVAVTLGYAEAARTGTLHELWSLVSGVPNMATAAAGFALLLMAAVASWRVARRRLRYETWWAVHLYFYLALALSFEHQVATGASFVGHPLARWWWTSLWLGTLGTVLTYRFGLPIWRSLRHRLRVVAVHEEGPGVASVILEGHHLERLRTQGGQFFQWRFLQRGLWWQAHPYSLSAMPRPPHLRITVKDLGDHSGHLGRIHPGTRVAIEGPYGTFTKSSRSTNRLALIGAGVGVTPLRALLEDLPDDVDVVGLLRASNHDETVLADEMRILLERRGGQLHLLVGSRRDVALDQDQLRQSVPDLARRDLYICGPAGFTHQVVDAALGLGTPPERIHTEAFAT
jgi:predicted ferric reductase